MINRWEKQQNMDYKERKEDELKEIIENITNIPYPLSGLSDEDYALIKKGEHKHYEEIECSCEYHEKLSKHLESDETHGNMWMESNLGHPDTPNKEYIMGYINGLETAMTHIHAFKTIIRKCKTK